MEVFFNMDVNDEMGDMPVKIESVDDFGNVISALLYLQDMEQTTETQQKIQQYQALLDGMVEEGFPVKIKSREDLETLLKTATTLI